MRSANDSGMGIGRLIDIATPRQRPGQRDAGGAPSVDITDALGEQLLNEPAPARAYRQADADFLLPPGRAREQHARDVRARDHQDEADDEHQAETDRQQRAVGQRMDVDVLGRDGADVEALVGRLVSGLQPLADEAQVRRRGVVGRARSSGVP